MLAGTSKSATVGKVRGERGRGTFRARDRGLSEARVLQRWPELRAAEKCRLIRMSRHMLNQRDK